MTAITPRTRSNVVLESSRGFVVSIGIAGPTGATGPNGPIGILENVADGTTPTAGHVLRGNGTEFSNSAIQAADLPTGIDAAKIGGGTISSAEFACLEGATSPLQEQLDTATAGAAAQFAAISVSLSGKANVGHTHAGTDITSGTVAPARLGSGTPTSATLLDGSGAWRALSASDIPNLDASKITSGTLNVGRLNSGTSGQFVRADGTNSNTLTDTLNVNGNLVVSGSGGIISTGGAMTLYNSTQFTQGSPSTTQYHWNGPVSSTFSTRFNGVEFVSVAHNAVQAKATLSVVGGLVAESLSLGTTATVAAGTNSITGTSLGPTMNAATGLSNRISVAGTVVANFGASEGTVGTDRFAVGRYASGSIDGTKSGISSNGTYMVYNADGSFGHYFRSVGVDNVRIQNGATWFFAPTASDYLVRIVSKSYYPSLTLETDATSPAGAGTWGTIRGYAGVGCYIYGTPSMVLFSGSGEAARLTNTTVQLSRDLSFVAGFGIPEEVIRSFANGGPNLANESLKQLRNGTIFSRAVNTGAAVQSRVNSVAIPGGAAIVYSGTGAQASAYLGESFVAVDTTKTYLLRGWLANTVNTTQQSYIGLLCYDSAGTILSYIYPAAYEVVAPSGGQWYQGYVSGTVFQGDGTVFPAGTQYVRTATLVGYGSPSGAWTTQTSPIEFIECPAQCGVFHNTTQSVADTTWTVAVFNSELVDTSGLHDTTLDDRRDRVNVPRTGKYRITAQAEFAANATGYRQARITVNGSALARSTKIVPNNGASLEAQASIEIYAILTAGDIVRLEAYQDSGGALNLTSNTRLYLLWISD
jgi:hypothetical protein